MSMHDVIRTAFPLNKMGAIKLLCLTLGAISALAHADSVDDYIKSEMSKRLIPGVSVAVIKDHKIIKEAAYGVANLELNVPLTVDTSFTLASMTKNFTAAAVMQLVEAGKISLDEKIIKVLPQLPAAWGDVTIRECLAHTSGLPDAVTDDINITPVSGDWNGLLEIISKQPVKTAGAESSYNQTGYVLLSMIIEQVSGMSYEDYMRTHIFKPAGINDVKFGDAWSIIPGRSESYTALDKTKDHLKLARLPNNGQPILLEGRIQRYGSKYIPDYMWCAGGLNGSLRDLESWEQALADGKIISVSSLKTMTAPYKLNDGKEGDFGLGYLTYSIGKYKVDSYGGGAATWRISVPEKKLTVIVLTNLQDSRPHEIAAKVAALIDPDVRETETAAK